MDNFNNDYMNMKQREIINNNRENLRNKFLSAERARPYYNDNDNDEPLSIEDIQYQNIEENEQIQAQTSRLNQRRQSRSQKDFAEGKPSRISQYKKPQPLFGGKESKINSGVAISSRMTPIEIKQNLQEPISRQIQNLQIQLQQRQRGPLSNDHAQSKDMSMDDSFGGPNHQNQKQLANEQDIKNVAKIQLEVAQILEILQEFEKNHGSAKKKMNYLDQLSLDSDLISQTVKTQYKIIQENLFDENPNFDQDKMEQKIDNILTKVKITNQDYNKLKGDFFNLHDAIINRDMLTLKIDRVIRQKDKQEEILPKCIQIEQIVRENQTNVTTIKKMYDNFEKNLFEKKISDTKQVIKDTQGLIQKIEIQQIKIQGEIQKVEQEVVKVLPQNTEQKLRLQKINNDIQMIEKRLKLTITNFQHEMKTQEQLELKHIECEDSTKKMNNITDLYTNLQQTRQLMNLIKNHNQWWDLNKRLKILLDEEISSAEFDLQKSTQDAKKNIDAIKNLRKDEYDDQLRQIQKIAKKVADDADGQEQRLKLFEQKTFNTENCFPDNDLIFLKKETARYRSTLQTVNSVKDNILLDTVEMNDKLINNQELFIINNDLNEVRAHLKNITKLDSIDIPRIQRNIDMLEGFTQKSLKNILNDDNKKSQVQISKMKKNYEDLQKQLDILNQKLIKVKSHAKRMQDMFVNEDLERENEIYIKVEDIIYECERNINGEKTQSGTDKTEENYQSLMQRKKQIIAAINITVNQFNENNKQVKEINKQQKSEREMQDLIKKNKEIQEDYKQIEVKVDNSKQFAAEIYEKLDQLETITLIELNDKYNEKNHAIDECDEIFDKANVQIDALDNIIISQLEEIKQNIEKIESVNPVYNPSTKDDDNGDFLDDVQDKLEQLYTLRDSLEQMQTQLTNTRDQLIDSVQPLNELGEREVIQEEIEEILKQLDVINENFINQEKNILKDKEINILKKEIDEMLEKNKEKKIQEANIKSDQLDLKQQNLEDILNNINQKLDELKKLTSEAKTNQAVDDPSLLSVIKNYEEDIKKMEKDLQLYIEQSADIRKKQASMRKIIQDAQLNPNKFISQDIDALIIALQDQIDQANELQDNLYRFINILDTKIEEIKNLVGQSQEKIEQTKKIQEIIKQLKEDMKKFEGVVASLPSSVESICQVLEEMKKDTFPDKSADYCDKKEDINDWIQNIKQLQKGLDKSLIQFQKKKQDVDNAINLTQRPDLDILILKKLVQDLKNYQKDLGGYLEEAQDILDGIQTIKKSMGECQIPVNIQIRKKELEIFSQRFDRIKEEFKDLKQADEDFKEGSEKEIKKLIQKIEGLLRVLETERNDYFKFQSGTLEKYIQKDFLENFNCKIIAQIKEFRLKIQDTEQRLKEIEELQNELNTRLIKQDMENATKIIGKKVKKLKERLEKTKQDLQQIFDCGKEMDGNTTHNEEDEFIEALEDEMPEVFSNIDLNLEQIDQLNDLVKKVEEKKNIESMQLLKREVDDATNKVEQSEGLVVKLENEIMEWHAFKKLCSRDEELQEIDALIVDFSNDIKQDHQVMENQFQRVSHKIDKEGDPKEELAPMLEGITSYIINLDELQGMLQALKQEKDDCFLAFDCDIPNLIKWDRMTRKQNSSENILSPKNKQIKPKGPKVVELNSPDNDKPSDIYYMLHINCKFKKRIHSLLKELREINQKRRELEEKYAPFKLNVSIGQTKEDFKSAQPIKAYKAVKGDPIDELFAYHLNKSQLNLPVKRLSVGKYMFGSKQIMAKIVAGKLVIRVGGGFMSADDFIEQYGKIELLKLMKTVGTEGNETPNIEIGDIKQQLKDALLSKIKIYSNESDGTSKMTKNVSGIQQALAKSKSTLVNKYEI